MRPKLNDIPGFDTPAVANHNCAANGCPMGGSLGNHTFTTPNSQFWCGFHNAVDAKFTQDVTKDVRNNFNLIQAAYSLMRVPISSKEAEVIHGFNERMKQIGKPEFAAKTERENKSAKLLGYRVIKDLTTKITANREKKVVSNTADGDDNILQLEAFLGAMRNEA